LETDETCLESKNTSCVDW